MIVSKAQKKLDNHMARLYRENYNIYHSHLIIEMDYFKCRFLHSTCINALLYFIYWELYSNKEQS